MRIIKEFEAIDQKAQKQAIEQKITLLQSQITKDLFVWLRDNFIAYNKTRLHLKGEYSDKWLVENIYRVLYGLRKFQTQLKNNPIEAQDILAKVNTILDALDSPDFYFGLGEPKP